MNVSIRDLRNHGGDVVDRVARGERVTITKAGQPVAELRPVRASGLSTDALIARWSHLPAMDPHLLRHDLDSAIDSSL